MYKYLFICEENIGRSQIAEGFYNKKHNGRGAISAGIIDSTRKYSGRPRDDVIQVMGEVGIDISGQRVKQLTEGMLEKAEKIVVLCDKKVCPEAITKRRNVIYCFIEDPPDEDKTIEVIRHMREKIKLIVDSLQ